MSIDEWLYAGVRNGEITCSALLGIERDRVFFAITVYVGDGRNVSLVRPVQSVQRARPFSDCPLEDAGAMLARTAIRLRCVLLLYRSIAS